MVYCISDIHGEIDKFHAMLELIQFSETDTLYVLGDVIDRYPGGVDILLEIMQSENIIMIKGNHEQMMYDDLGPIAEYGARQLWLSNGGGCTRRELLYHMRGENRRKILRFVNNLPEYLDIEVEGKPFHLVHGFPGDDTETRIWGRIEPDTENPKPGKTVIVGHTPTCFLTDDFGSPFRIWKRPGIIDIDCGCGNETDMRALACLRLNNMEEFYV